MMVQLNEKCSECNSSITCTADDSCWCQAYPVLQELSEDKTCLCKYCLEKKLANQINKRSSEVELEDRIKIGTLGEPNYLRKDVDYYIEKIGGRELYIFTKWHLLRQGVCCNNSCRHCPYPKE